MDLLMQFTTTKSNMYPTPPWRNAAHVTTSFNSRNFLCWDAKLLPTPQLQELIGQQNKGPKLLYDPRINLQKNIFAKVLSQPPTQGHMDEARELIFSHQLLEVMTGLIGHAHNLLNKAYIHQQGLHVQQAVDAFNQLTMSTRCRNTCSVIPHADHDFMAADILNPGISNADAKLSTLNLSSTISLLSCSPLINSRCSFAVPFCTTRVICTALWRNDAIVSKSVSMQPRDVIAGVPGGANQEKSFRSPPTTYLYFRQTTHICKYTTAAKSPISKDNHQYWVFKCQVEITYQDGYLQAAKHYCLHRQHSYSQWCDMLHTLPQTDCLQINSTFTKLSTKCVGQNEVYRDKGKAERHEATARRRVNLQPVQAEPAAEIGWWS